jgi:aquaporin Z
MKKYGAELFGTYVLMFAGLGAALFEGTKIGYLGISLAFGVALIAMAYTVGPISGCHLNPAVTIGAAVAGRLRWGDVTGYVIAQVLGAICACGTLVLIFQNGFTGGAGPGAMVALANGFGDHSPSGSAAGFGVTAAFVAEMIATFVLAFTVLGSTAPKSEPGFAGIPIGFALAVGNLVIIPITNGSINPARSIGPAIYAQGWAFSQLWLFIAAPIVGAILAAIIYRLIEER